MFFFKNHMITLKFKVNFQTCATSLVTIHFVNLEFVNGLKILEILNHLHSMYFSYKLYD
jgi:hypothetical protein